MQTKIDLNFVVESEVCVFCQALTYNVFALKKGRFETVSYRNINNKAKCLMDICKEKINVFPAGTNFANAYTSASLFFSVC